MSVVGADVSCRCQCELKVPVSVEGAGGNYVFKLRMLKLPELVTNIL